METDKKTRCHRIRTQKFGGEFEHGHREFTPHDHGQERRDSFVMAVYEFRLFDLPVYTWWVWLLLIPTEDFFFYWYHRCSHEVRLQAAMSIITAARRSTYDRFETIMDDAVCQLGVLCHCPYWGFIRPWLSSLTISLLYQYWVHELIKRMGPLEWVMNALLTIGFIMPSIRNI